VTASLLDSPVRQLYVALMTPVCTRTKLQHLSVVPGLLATGSDTRG